MLLDWFHSFFLMTAQASMPSGEDKRRKGPTRDVELGGLVKLMRQAMAGTALRYAKQTKMSEAARRFCLIGCSIRPCYRFFGFGGSR